MPKVSLSINLFSTFKVCCKPQRRAPILLSVCGPWENPIEVPPPHVMKEGELKRREQREIDGVTVGTGRIVLAFAHEGETVLLVLEWFYRDRGFVLERA